MAKRSRSPRRRSFRRCDNSRLKAVGGLSEERTEVRHARAHSDGVIDMHVRTFVLVSLAAASPALAQQYTIVDDGIVVPLGGAGTYHEYNVARPR